jgi:hypothetical protein
LRRAAQGPRPAIPNLADALGATPTVPDASAASKKGASTFDTLPSEFSADLSTRPSRDAIIQRPSLGKRASRGLARFLIIFCTGVAATLAWQSYGDAAREMIANSYPQLSWLAPQAAPLAQTASDTPAPAPSATPSPELKQPQGDVVSFRHDAAKRGPPRHQPAADGGWHRQADGGSAATPSEDFSTSAAANRCARAEARAASVLGAALTARFPGPKMTFFYPGAAMPR